MAFRMGFGAIIRWKRLNFLKCICIICFFSSASRNIILFAFCLLLPLRTFNLCQLREQKSQSSNIVTLQLTKNGLK